MKSGKIFALLILSLFFLISACSEEKQNGDFSGVSELIAERNRARHDVAEKPSQRKLVTQKKAAGQPQTAPSNQTVAAKNDGISSVILYEQKIEIVGAESGRKMAKGIAYVNKQGQIVRIKILRD